MTRIAAVTIAGAILWGGMEDVWSPDASVEPRPDTLTFAEHIAPILFRECASCHRPGGSGGFSVLAYNDVRPWAAVIAEAVESRRMPPWLPQQGFGRFAAERRLEDEEIELIRRWAAAGAPSGDLARLPAPPDVGSGWQLGVPDLVVRFPRYTVPAAGRDLYRNLVAPIPIATRRHVATVEVRPGNPRVVHHARLMVDTTSSSRDVDARDPAPGFDGMELVSEAGNPPGHFLGWTPGKMPLRGADDLAWPVAPGTDFVLQLHLRPTGELQSVEPVVGVHFADAPSTKQPVLVLLSSKTIDIPAGATDHVVTDTYQLPVDVDVLGIYPHAHYLGKTLEGFASLPDGSRRWLLRIPQWDFDWQDEYRYAAPVPLPAGAVLTMRYTYDNSARNPRNPHRPPQRVRYGPNSTDEMGDLVIQVLPRTPADRERLAADLGWKYEVREVTFLAHRATVAGRDALARGDSSEALRQLREALRHRAVPEVHAEIAALLAAQGKVDEATLHAERAAQMAAATGNAALARTMRETAARYRRTPRRDWMLGPFLKPAGVNPVIEPRAASTFACPMTDSTVHWEEYATFNPAAVVRDGKVYVLYRAEDASGEMRIGHHTSRIGLAESTDGFMFTRRPAPVLYPDDDEQAANEWPGGVEDPRIVETEDGTYVLTYTQWNRDVPRLAVATSRDLVSWTKHGPAFARAHGGKYLAVESKSGAILSRVDGDRLIATRVNGTYWMYYGVPQIHIATSDNLIDWTPIEDERGSPLAVLSPRPGYFDSWLVEAGPPAILTERGIVVLYNAGNSERNGDPALPARVYSGGQALFDEHDPTRLLDRTSEPFIKPTEDYERTGQYVEGTTFVEGLVRFNGRWLLYYGTADSRVALAESPANPD